MSRCAKAIDGFVIHLSIKKKCWDNAILLNTHPVNNKCSVNLRPSTESLMLPLSSCKVCVRLARGGIFPNYLPVEAVCSLFQSLMLNCDTLPLDPKTQAFEGTASAIKNTVCNFHLFLCYSHQKHIWPTSASAPLYGVKVNVLVQILIC